MPDRYRGIYRGDDGNPGARYADHVASSLADLEQAGHTPAAFLCESVLGCGGQVALDAQSV